MCVLYKITLFGGILVCQLYKKNTFSKGKTLNILVLLHILIYQTLNFFN